MLCILFGVVYVGIIVMNGSLSRCVNYVLEIVVLFDDVFIMVCFVCRCLLYSVYRNSECVSWCLRLLLGCVDLFFR